MKLISCYIENFGKLSKQKIDFNPDLHIIKEDNGWGKTTLAAFIKSMFYGLPTAQKSGIKENDRFRYSPWQGGKYGGYLIFEYNNRLFRVERYFGATSSSHDNFSLFDERTHKQLSMDEKDFGKRIFGIDAQSYSRSTFVPQNAITLDSLSGDLNNKLIELICGTDGGAGYDSALKKLSNTQSKLRKTRPHKGKLDIVEENIQKVKTAIEDCQNFEIQAQRLRQSISDAKEQLRKSESALRDLEQKIEIAQTKSEIIANKKLLDSMIKTIETESKKLEQLTAFFKGKDIESIDLDNIKNSIKEAKEKSARLNILKEKIIQLKTALFAEKLQPVPQKGATNKTFKYLMLCIGSGALISGITSFFFNIIVGAVLTGLGALALLFTLIVYYIDSRLPAITHSQEQTGQNESQIKSAEDEINSLENEQNQTKSELEKLYQSIDTFLSGFMITSDLDNKDLCIAEIESNIKAYKEALDNKRAAEVELDKFSKEKDISMLQHTSYEEVDIDELKDEKSKVTFYKESQIQKIAELKSQLEKAEEEANAKESLRYRLEDLISEQKELSQVYEALKLTGDFLTQAKDNLASKYLEPITNSCKEYLSHFFDEQVILNFDADTKPLVEEGGHIRSLEYYSCGLREMMSLCARIALADALFQKEKAYIILDDPFSNLDDQRLERAKKFLTELSKKYQIIYFTCQSGRMITL